MSFQIKGTRSGCRVKVGALAATGALILASCSSSGGSSAGTSGSAASGVDSAIRAMLPANIRSADKLNVGITSTLPPYNYADSSGHLTGISVDLGSAVAAMLGVKLQYTSTNQALLITGIQSGKFDVGTIAFSDTGSDVEKDLTFIDYLKRSIRLIVQKNNRKKVTSVEQFCSGSGSIAVGTSTAYAGWLEDQSKSCVAAGKKAIKISKYANGSEVTQAVVAGRDDAALLDTLSGAYTAQKGGNLAEVGPTYLTVLSGWGVDPKNTALAQAIQAALQKLIDNGTYAKVLDKYNAPASMQVSKVLVNGGTSTS